MKKKISKSMISSSKKGFTLAEVKPSRGRNEVKVESESTETFSFRCEDERCRLMRGAVRCGFTLAEVLITLGVIGIVATMTLPTLLNTLHTKATERKREVFERRLLKGLNEMAVQSTLMGYESSYDFAKALSQHYKMFNICNTNDISKCYNVDEVIIDTDGNTIKISDIKKAKNLGKDGDEWLDPVAFVATDGSVMIFSYNKDCKVTEDEINPQKSFGGGEESSSGGNTIANTSAKPTYSGVVNKCIAGVYDYNGASQPNRQTSKNRDILSYNGGTLAKGKSCIAEIGSLCISKTAFYSTPVTKAECEAMKSTHGIRGCQYDNDYWAGAVKECGHVNKLPSQSQLKDIADYIYAGTPSERAAELGLPAPTFFLWSGEEYDSHNAYYRDFYSGASYSGNYYRSDRARLSVCLGD